MSFPNIPNVTPSVSLTREDVINLLLASIAFEELGLAHILNAEGEKIQFVIHHATSITDIVLINESVNDVLKTTAKKEMLLQFKLEEIAKVVHQSTTSTTSTTSTSTTTTTSTTSTTTTTTTRGLLFVFGDIASATGTTESGVIVNDEDDAFYNTDFAPVFSGYTFTTSTGSVLTGPAPSISVTKQVSVNGGATYQDANLSPGPALASGKAFFRVTVANTGNVDLFNVTITDASLGLATIVSSLASGSEIMITAAPN